MTSGGVEASRASDTSSRALAYSSRVAWRRSTRFWARADHVGTEREKRMAWSMNGSYVANCNCHGVCPRPTGQKPSSDSGECVGAAIFHIDRGDCDGVDLSGLEVALYNHFPTTLTEGKLEGRDRGQ